MKPEDQQELLKRQTEAKAEVENLKKILRDYKLEPHNSGVSADDPNIQKLEEKISQIEAAFDLTKDAKEFTKHHYEQLKMLRAIDTEVQVLNVQLPKSLNLFIERMSKGLNDYCNELLRQLSSSAQEAFPDAHKEGVLDSLRHQKIAAVRAQYQLDMSDEDYLKLKFQIELIDRHYETLKKALNEPYPELPESAVQPLSAFIGKGFSTALTRIQQLNNELEQTEDLHPGMKVFITALNNNILEMQQLSSSLSEKECAKQSVMDEGSVEQLSGFIARVTYFEQLVGLARGFSKSLNENNTSSFAVASKILEEYSIQLEGFVHGGAGVSSFAEELSTRYLEGENAISTEVKKLQQTFRKRFGQVNREAYEELTKMVNILKAKNATLTASSTPAEPILTTQPQKIDSASTANPAVVTALQKPATGSKSNTPEPVPVSANTTQTNQTQTQQTEGPVNAVDKTLVKEVIDVIRAQRTHRPKIMEFLARLGLNLRRTKDGLTKGFTQFLESKTTIQKDELNYYLERFKMAQQSLEQNRPNKALEEQSIKDLLAYITTDSKDTTLLSFRSKKEDLGILSLRSRHGFDKEEKRYQEVMKKFKK